MKYTLKTFGILVIIGSAAASVASAYTAPLSNFPQNNGEVVPITIGTIDQSKAGNLAVDAFQVQGNAWMQQETYLEGPVIGGSVETHGTIISNTVNFGGLPESIVSAEVENGSVTVEKRFQSDKLAHGDPNAAPGSDLRKVCFDGSPNTNGVLVLCN